MSLPFSRVLSAMRLLGIVLGLAALIVVIGFTVVLPLRALVYPWELELREGTSWLYVLTARAGISIYDFHKVAYLNMNHGPLDPLLKHAVATLLPFLGPHMVTRIFVILLPLGLFFMFMSLPGTWYLAVGGCCISYIAMVGLQPPNFLVGRSDPAAMFFLSLMITVCMSAAQRPKSTTLWTLAGFLSTAVILCNWRYLPAVCLIITGFMGERLSSRSAAPNSGILVPAARWFGGLIVPAAIVVFSLFGLDFLSYWKHFFGFFTPDSGWGAYSEGTFTVFPTQLLLPRIPFHFVLGGGLLLGVAFPSNTVPRKTQLLIWLPILGVLWAVTGWGYFLNRSGGGVYYYAPFYLVAFVYIYRALDIERIQATGGLGFAITIIIPVLPLRDLYMEAVHLGCAKEIAVNFLVRMKQTAGTQRILSETYHLFKSEYGGEIIDMGDVVSRVRRTGYFGPELSATVDSYFTRLQENPPPFILTGGLESPEVNALLATDYELVLTANPALAPVGKLPPALYRKKSGS